MNNIATIHLKDESGPISIGGVVAVQTNEDFMVTVHSHDAGTGNCRDTFVPREDVRVVSIEYRD